MSTNVKCPVCDGAINEVDLPHGYKVYVCVMCKEIIQLLADGTAQPIGQFLKRNELGDDRARAAVSEPQISTVKSFLEILDSVEHQRAFTLGQATTALRQVLAQVENRIDLSVRKLSGYAMVIDEIDEVLAALREARELVSTTAGRTRGLPVVSET